MLLDGWNPELRLPKWENKLRQQEGWILNEINISKEKLYEVMEVLQEYGVVE